MLGLMALSTDLAEQVSASTNRRASASYTDRFILPPGTSTAQQLDLGLLRAGEFSVTRDEITVTGIITQTTRGTTTCYDLYHFLDRAHARRNDCYSAWPANWTGSRGAIVVGKGGCTATSCGGEYLGTGAPLSADHVYRRLHLDKHG